MKKLKECDFEILISTKQRSSLDFLLPIFPEGDLGKYNILIINQTDGAEILESNSDLIRVVNSTEIGLSKSRNLALQNAIGKICLIADDDVQYVKGFDHIIEQTYNKFQDAALITFKISTLNGEEFKPYPSVSKKVEGINELENISSIEMTFNRAIVLQKNIRFNELFGLNSIFPCGEEFVFSKDVLDAGCNVYYENTIIVKHEFIRSTSDLGANHLVYAKGALKYIKNNYLSPLMYINMMWYLLKNKYITIFDVPNKLKIAFKGRSDYKKTTKNNHGEYIK